MVGIEPKAPYMLFFLSKNYVLSFVLFCFVLCYVMLCLFFVFPVLGIKPRSLSLKYILNPFFKKCFFKFWDRVSLVTKLPRVSSDLQSSCFKLPECWDYSHTPLCSVSFLCFPFLSFLIILLPQPPGTICIDHGPRLKLLRLPFHLSFLPSWTTIASFQVSVPH